MENSRSLKNTLNRKAASDETSEMVKFYVLNDRENVSIDIKY